jgi:hypothetical protein
MKYAKFERIVVLVIIITIAVMAAAMIVHKTDGVEIVGHVLMIVVIVCSLYWGERGALGSFLFCFITYSVLRLAWPGDFNYGTIFQLIMAKFLVFGILALLCSYIRTQFRYYFVKMESEDFIDDETQLGNARFLIKELTSRIHENERYAIIFSLIDFSFDQRLIDGMRKDHDTNLLRDIGVSILKADTRTVDELGRFDNQLFVVLPSVGRAGAMVCAGRLEFKIQEYLQQHIPDMEMEKVVKQNILEYPEDKAKVVEILAQLREEIGD